MTSKGGNGLLKVLLVDGEPRPPERRGRDAKPGSGKRGEMIEWKRESEKGENPSFLGQLANLLLQEGKGVLTDERKTDFCSTGGREETSYFRVQM